MERARLEDHASGKMARALGRALAGESQEKLDRIAQEDQRLTQQGMVKLKVGGEIRYRPVDELTREDRRARIAAGLEEVDWLMNRVGLRKEQGL